MILVHMLLEEGGRGVFYNVLVISVIYISHLVCTYWQSGVYSNQINWVYYMELHSPKKGVC